MRRLVLLPLLTLSFTLAPLPPVTEGPPRTLTDVRDLGVLEGMGPAVTAPFAIEYLGISWLGGEEPEVRFRREGGWTSWVEAHEDGLGEGRRRFSSLIPGRGAGAFQLRGRARAVETMAINTTDGPSSFEWGGSAAEASHLEPPGVISRRAWGADESLRFVGPRERRPRSIAPVQKLVIHHTATPRWDAPRPAIRAIYRYHAVFRGWGDIGYHYLIAADGRIFKGRYTGPPGTRAQDRSAADRGRGWGIAGVHSLGANRGTVGIALLGNYDRSPMSTAARDSLVGLLAWLSDRYGIDPTGRSVFRGTRRTFVTKNIAGHRAYGPTECPGTAVTRELPGIRRDVARSLRAGGPQESHAPVISSVWTPRVGRNGVLVRWATDRPSRSVIRFRREGREGAWRRARPAGLRTRHAVRLRPLRAGSTYVFRLGADDDDGDRRWSAPGFFRTKG